MKTYVNPFEIGVANATADLAIRQENPKAVLKSRNPFAEFSDKWALYNRGYNTTMGWSS